MRVSGLSGFQSKTESGTESREDKSNFKNLFCCLQVCLHSAVHDCNAVYVNDVEVPPNVQDINEENDDAHRCTKCFFIFGSFCSAV